MSRLVGIGVLIYAFRVETIGAVSAWMSVNRGVVPLAVGLSALVLSVLVELGRARLAGVRGL